MVLARTIALAAGLPLLLTACAIDPAYPDACDFTTVAFALPEVDVPLELTAFACVDGGHDAPGVTLWMDDGRYDGAPTDIAFTAVGKGVSEPDEYLEANASYSPELCDDGIAVAITRTAASAPRTAVLRLNAYAGDSWKRCDVHVEPR